MRRIALCTMLPALALLGACAQQPRANADALTPQQQELLAKHLGNKTAGTPVSCISQGISNDMIRVNDYILLYRVSSKLVYRNDLPGGCPGLARNDDVMVTQQLTGRPCSGDIIRLVDRTSGIGGGSCVLGKFTPYRTTD